MNEDLAKPDILDQIWKESSRPPPKLTVSEWADLNYYMSPESSASPGKWKTLPYQRGWMDAFSDPDVEQISVMKSARTGFTQSVGAVIGYFIEHDPCPISVVQPTLDMAKVYSKEFIGPMIKATPVLNKIVYQDEEEKAKDTTNTILHKHFPGGVLSLIGANSGAGFRMVGRRIGIADEPDAYPPSAGQDGDQIELLKRRTEAYWNRKIGAGCTPLIAGISKIEELFNAGDQRRFYVPCPHCGHMDFLSFKESKSGGHWMRWDKDDGSDAHFICRGCGCEIEHRNKNDMVARGEWRAAKPFKKHASFHIWAAYSPNINASWAQIAAEWLAASKGGPEKLKTFINTVLGETWTERGEAPDWERLYARRESYQLGTIPEGVLFLTAGLDVQKNRVVYSVHGWGRNRECWVIDASVLQGDTSDLGPRGPWPQVSELLHRIYQLKNGVELRISRLAVDSGAFTQAVYEWVRSTGNPVVMAIKGDEGHRPLVGTPVNADVDWEGKRVTNGVMRWPVGSDTGKQELYGLWKISILPGDPHPPGYWHFADGLDQEYFKQITAEHLVTHKHKNGRVTLKWEPIPGRENHWLDCAVYARAGAAVLGLDRFTESDWQKLEQVAGVDRNEHHTGTPQSAQALKMIPDSGNKWIRPKPGGWLKKR